MLPKGLLKEYARPLSIFLRMLDVVAMLFSGYAAYFYKFGSTPLSLHYVIAFSVGAIVTFFVFPFFRIYESVRAKGFGLHLWHLIQAVVTVLMLLAGFAFLTKTGEQFSRIWFLCWGLSFLGLLILFRGALLIFLCIMRARGWNERRVIIIGAGDLGKKLAETVHQSLWTGFRIVTFFDDHIENKPADFHTIPIQVTPDNLHTYFSSAKETIDEIWLALPLRAEVRVKEILHELRHETITTRFVLDIFGMDLLNHSVANLAGFPVLNIRSTPMMGMNRVTKAIEDRVLSSVILLITSPLFLLISLLIKYSSPGPIFYKQQRVGWNGKTFDIIKFRSMPVNIENKTGAVWASQHENRATKIGHFLRKTSLDELPQLINVLRGDMSIVGPRPERPVFVEKFKHEIPRYMQKHVVKAGITGWAQVNGWRGNTSLEKRIEYDLYYIENWSLGFDLKIIFLTVFRGLIHKNAY